LEGKERQMNSTISPDAVLSARADERLAHAYEQIARADDELTRVTEKLSRMEHDAARRPAVAYSPQPVRGGSGSRGLIAFLLAACIGGAAFASHSSYGEAAREAIAPFVPSYVSAAWLSVKPQGAAQQGSSPVQLAAAGTTLLQPVPVAQTPVQDVPPTTAAAAPSADVTQMLQSMAHDIAAVEQGIEQLKANQAQMAADNARAVEELRAGQEQLTHLAARSPAKPAAQPAAQPVAQETRTKPPSPPPGAPKPVASAAHKPPAAAPPPPARPRAQPVQLQPDAQ
jgi:hypothetical protein